MNAEDNMDYAVFKTGGKQYRVKPGDTLDVELLPNQIDTLAEFGEVLCLSDGGEVTFGSPLIAGAKVTAQVLSHYKDRKLMVFKYKAKNRYRRKRGHRQTYTRLRIQDIELSTPSARAPRSRAASGAAAPEAESAEGEN